MTDARWIEVDLESACHHFRNAAWLSDDGGFEVDDLTGYRARMALMHAMQLAHTSLESALKRILMILGEEAPIGMQSHADLVRRVSKPLTAPGHIRPAILSPTVARDVDEARRFRHRAPHDYDNFEANLARPVDRSGARPGRQPEALHPAVSRCRRSAKVMR